MSIAGAADSRGPGRVYVTHSFQSAVHLPRSKKKPPCFKTNIPITKSADNTWGRQFACLRKPCLTENQLPKERAEKSFGLGVEGTPPPGSRNEAQEQQSSDTGRGDECHLPGSVQSVTGDTQRGGGPHFAPIPRTDPAAPAPQVSCSQGRSDGTVSRPRPQADARAGPQPPVTRSLRLDVTG